MIATTKEPRGVLITICNYDLYQNPENYERTNGRTNESTELELRENQSVPSINKNDKNDNNKNNGRFKPPDYKDVEIYCNEKNYSININNFIDFYESKGWMVGKNKMKDWKAAIRNARNWTINKNKKSEIDYL
jgi:hypothetical protein